MFVSFLLRMIPIKQVFLLIIFSYTLYNSSSFGIRCPFVFNAVEQKPDKHIILFQKTIIRFVSKQ